MEENQYTKHLAKNQDCAIFHVRDTRKNVLPKLTKLSMETQCWFPFEGHKYGRRKQKDSSVFEFFYKSVNSSLEELIKIKVIFILKQEILRQQNLKKIGNIFSLHESCPGRHLNTASRKSLEIQASLYRKKKRPFEPNICIQLFREPLSEKVHATIPKGIVGGFEFNVLQRNLKEWHKRPWTRLRRK